MAENQTRWWEFYAVRYAMGTVVGAIALLLLARNFPDYFCSPFTV
jgi:cytochrome bd-type quinol oxidase subunit 1